MKNYTKLDELKSENAILKTKIKKLEYDLAIAKEMINLTHDINLDLLKQAELYKKENNYGREDVNY
jgi:hypothetical protein